MKCIAIDDEPLALTLLEDNIRKVPFLELKGSCNDAFEAMEVFQKEKIDLIFIDIQMPGLSGLDFIRSLENRPLIILITAYKQYALEGFDLAVTDYLLKPVGMDRFLKACNKAKALYDLKATSNSVQEDFFFVSADYSQIKVHFKDIIWLEALGDYVKFHLDSQPHPLVVRATIKDLENLLPARQFIRIHKSWILSTSRVTAIRKNSVFIGEKEFSVGDSYKGSLEKIRGNRWI